MKYIHIKPEHKFRVTTNAKTHECKIFNTLDSAVVFAVRMMNEKGNYTFIGLKDDVHRMAFDAKFKYVDENGNVKIATKSIAITNAEEVERIYKPVSNFEERRILQRYSWDRMRALYGFGPFA